MRSSLGQRAILSRAEIAVRSLSNLPLNGRKFSSITMFLPGAVTTEPTIGTFAGGSSLIDNTFTYGESVLHGRTDGS
jgi:hypothetical protein